MHKGGIQMKKAIAFLAAISMACGSFCTALSAAADTAVTAETAAEAETYDLSSPKKTVKEGSIEYAIYNGYAAVSRVYDEDIEEFTVPETYGDLPVIGLAEAPFRNCKKLRKITLSKNVCVFDWESVAEEGMAEIAVDGDSEYYTVADGVLYSKDMKELVCCPTACGKTEITIPDRTERIGKYAFICCRDLKKVVMSSSVSAIGACAFWGCSGLTEIALPDTVTSVENGVFAGCSSLKSFDIPDSVEMIDAGAFHDAGCIETWNGIHYVDGWAVGSDKDIEAANIREGTVGTAMGLFAVYPRKLLTEITVPASVKHLGSYLYLGVNDSLRKVNFYNDAIPEKCILTNTLREVYIYDPFCNIADSSGALPSYWKEVDTSGLSDSEEKSVEYKLGYSAVQSSNTTASSVKVAVNTAIFEVDTPETEEEANERINKAVAEYMEKQKQPEPQKAPVKAGGSPRYDTVIHAQPYSTAVYYAAKYRRVVADLPYEWSYSEHTGYTEDGIEYWIYDDGFAYAMIPEDSKLKTNVYIPEEINGVPVTGFRDNTGYDSFSKYNVHLPKTVKTVKWESSAGRDNVMYYEVSEDNPYICSVDGIVYSKDMTRLIKIPTYYKEKEITVPEGVKTISCMAGWAMNNVQTLILPEGLEVIGEGGFGYSPQLVSVKLPETLDVIGGKAFSDCGLLENITVPDSVQHIGYKAFDGTLAVTYENGFGYVGKWLVETDLYGENFIIRDNTEGIATVELNCNTVIPASITKMSWEMTDSWNNRIERADVYSHIISYDAFKNAKYMKDIYIYDPDCQICEGENTIPARYQEYKEPDYTMGIPFMPPVHDPVFTRTPATDKKSYNYDGFGGFGTGAYEQDDEGMDVVIHGYKGSTAEVYANLYGRKFEALDDDGAYKNGDLNGDASLNVGDLVLMNRYMHGTYDFTEMQAESADLNGDGKADVFDVIVYRRKIVE